MEAPKTVIKEGKVHSDLSLEIIESLKRILCWYEAMIDTKSGRFIYEYDVTNHVSIMENCPIREMGSVWDISELLHFAKFHNINLRSESFPASKQFHSFRLEDKIQEWIQHYVSMVSPFRSFKQQNVQAAHINSAKIQEPASIAHNAFLILCLLTDETSRRSYLEIARMLAEGIIAQQRTDGSYKVYFSDVKDSGVELYAGESMLALMRFHHLTQDPDCLRSVEAALPYYQDFYYDGNIPESSTVFFFNWMAQSLKLLYCHTQDNSTKESIIKMLMDLQEALTDQGFYKNIRYHPRSVATVVVASALEGLADLCWILGHEQMEDQRIKYKEDINVMMDFLMRVQNKDCKSRGFGGFGHSVTAPLQRIDVTGHALSAFMKVLDAKMIQ